MAVKIKLKRMGKIRAPQYRIVVADARTKRDGKAIEEIGKYHPLEEPSFIEVNSERAQYWLSVGAQPTDPVQRILRLTGDWQRHKGLPEPPPLKVAAPKPDKEAEFQAVLKELVLPDSDDKSKGPGKKQDKGGKAATAAGSSAKADKAEKAEQTEQAGGDGEDTGAAAAKDEG